MRVKLKKRIGCLMIALCFMILECGAISAEELPVVITKQADLSKLYLYDTNGDGEVTAVVIGGETSETPEEGGMRLMSSVKNDGVRLRNAPNNSATVLELMYVGESVTIYINDPCTGTGWYYLKRTKTGTYGYASSAYIIYN